MADLRDSAKVWVAHTEYTISNKIINGKIQAIGLSIYK
jgi:hypothetical protein